MYRKLGLIGLVCGIWLLCIGATTWRTTNQRPYYFQADRGTVSDSVMILTGSTVQRVRNLAGDTIRVRSWNTAKNVVTRRKYITGSNGRIRAYPSYYTGADTAGQGVDATYLGGSRYLWYLQNPSWAPYTFYEIGGSGGDSLIAELTQIPITGKVAPDSMVDRTALVNGIISDSLLFAAGANLGVRKFERVISQDSLYVRGHSKFGDAVTDTAGFTGRIVANQYIDVTNNGINTDAIRPYDAGFLSLSSSDSVSVYATTSGKVPALSLLNSTGTQGIRLKPVLNARWTLTLPPGPGSTNDLLFQDAAGLDFTNAPSLASLTLSTTLTNNGHSYLGNGAADSTIAYNLRVIGPVKFQHNVQLGNASADAISCPGILSTTDDTNLGNGSGDQVTVIGDSLVTRAPLGLGGNGTAGKQVWRDGSGNTITQTCPAVSANTSYTVLSNMIVSTQTFNDTVSPYWNAYYIAGITANDHAWVQTEDADIHSGSATVRQWSTQCKTDSVLVQTSASSTSLPIAIWIARAN